MITESLHTFERISQEEKSDKFPDIERDFFSKYIDDKDKNNLDSQYDLNYHNSPIFSSNGNFYCLILYNLLFYMYVYSLSIFIFRAIHFG